MIRIRKPEAPPEVLSSLGAEETNRLCVLYENGERQFRFRREIYSHSLVKQALILAQHGKCCFCESQPGVDGDVEHFRPKAAFRQDAGAELESPAYYWLAYEWGNLLLACGPCNSRHKRNLFPLQDPAARARSHHDRLDLEQPLYLDPSREDPELFIGWRADVPYAIDGNPRGEATIIGLGLQRRFDEARRDHLQRVLALSALTQIARHARDLRLLTILEAEIERVCSDRALFAAMTRAALKTLRSSLP